MVKKQILMLGNSSIYLNKLPTILADILDARVVYITQGKASLCDFLDLETNVGYLLNKVKDENWDYVVMQDLSTNPSLNPQIFKKSTIALSMKFSNCKNYILFENIPYKDDCKLQSYGLNKESMYLLTKKACEEVATIGGFEVARVGELFHKIGNTVNLYADDGCHPNQEGSIIAAYVIADTITHLNMSDIYLQEHFAII